MPSARLLLGCPRPRLDWGGAQASAKVGWQEGDAAWWERRSEAIGLLVQLLQEWVCAPISASCVSFPHGGR